MVSYSVIVWLQVCVTANLLAILFIKVMCTVDRRKSVIEACSIECNNVVLKPTQLCSYSLYVFACYTILAT